MSPTFNAAARNGGELRLGLRIAGISRQPDASQLGYRQYRRLVEPLVSKPIRHALRGCWAKDAFGASARAPGARVGWRSGAASK